MAILLTGARLTRTQRLIIEANAPKPRAPRPLYAYDAHVQTYRDYLIANHDKVVVCKTTGRPLKAQKWFQRDYMMAAPKGLVLKSDKLRGVNKRWSIS